MLVEIKRTHFLENAILGEMLVTNEVGYHILKLKTLELPYRDNKPFESCIYEGVFDLIFRISKKFKRHFHIRKVKGRKRILIHKGNFPCDTKGCVLVGMVWDMRDKGKPAVRRSKKAMEQLLDTLGTDEIHRIKVSS